MPRKAKSKFSCFLLIDPSSKYIPLIEALSEAARDVNIQLQTVRNRKTKHPYDYIELNEIAKSDLIIAEISETNPEVAYGMGIAEAFGKTIISLIKTGGVIVNASSRHKSIIFDYLPTKKGIERFKSNFKSFLKDYIKNPTRFKSYSPFSKRIAEPSYIIDLGKLDPREFDNLCFELISQMGFKRVSWEKKLPEIDVIASLPKKDPDGYEYQELWLIITGNRSPARRLLEILINDPEYFLIRLQRNLESPDLFTKERIRFDEPITVLFILKEGDEQNELFERRIEQTELRIRHRKQPVNLRIRTWDSNYLTNLIQNYPQIAFKYFSEQSRIKSKYRKTPEELYEENVTLSDELLRSKSLLEEEKKKRFIAERETAWKDVAFKAAHKLGNPIDATDTFLQVLKMKLDKKDFNEVNDIIKEMDITIEEAKSVVEQFKSLTKIDEIRQKPCDIISLIKHSCKTAEEQGVEVKIHLGNKIPDAMIDPGRITECFNELVANSLHWFDKKKKIISVTIEKLKKNEISEPLDSKESYLKIKFEDNGCGIVLENKEKVFSPFFTTYQHGSGIGLSIVKKIIDLHGGLISEVGKPGEGASFIIILPTAKQNKLKS